MKLVQSVPVNRNVWQYRPCSPLTKIKRAAGPILPDIRHRVYLFAGVSVNFSAIFDTHTCYYVQRQAEGGRAEGILQVATQMKRLGIPVKQICQATGLSEEKVAASIFR